MNQSKDTRKQILMSTQLISNTIQGIERKICHRADNPSKVDIENAALDIENIKDEEYKILDNLKILKEE